MLTENYRFLKLRPVNAKNKIWFYFSSITGDNWELSDGAKLHDVTHLPCRSARYQPLESNASPANAKPSEFPVTPGGEMPSVDGCKKQDYWVIFVLALESVAE